MENKDIQKQLDRIESLLLDQKTVFLSQKTVFNLFEVADYTGLSRSYIYKLTCSGGIPCYKPNGKQIYFNKQEIDNWLMQNRKATSEEIEEKAVNHVISSERGDK